MRLVGQRSSACELAREQISLHLDGELSELEQVALNGHLTGCAQCRAYGASVAGVSTQLRSAPLEQPEFPVVLPHRSRIRIPLRAVQAGAAAAVVAAIGFSGAGLTSGGERSVSLIAGNTSPNRGPILRPTGAGRAAIEFRVERRTVLRPIRGHIRVV
jgi:predicted anti-sigma-YlaC factor YlaD